MMSLIRCARRLSSHRGTVRNSNRDRAATEHVEHAEGDLVAARLRLCNPADDEVGGARMRQSPNSTSDMCAGRLGRSA